jgi:hypothetical protein
MPLSAHPCLEIRQFPPGIYCIDRIPFPLQLSFTRHIFYPEEELMTYSQIRRLVRLHEKASRHSENYKKLSKDSGAQSKALDHLMKAERLYRQVSDMIKDMSSA